MGELAAGALGIFPLTAPPVREPFPIVFLSKTVLLVAL